MPRTKTQRCRRLLVLFCMFVIFSASFTVPAFADYVNVTTGTSYSYFQTYSSKGVFTTRERSGLSPYSSRMRMGMHFPELCFFWSAQRMAARHGSGLLNKVRTVAVQRYSANLA